MLLCGFGVWRVACVAECNILVVCNWGPVPFTHVREDEDL